MPSPVFCLNDLLDPWGQFLAFCEMPPGHRPPCMTAADAFAWAVPEGDGDVTAYPPLPR